MPTIVHLDIATDNPQRARAFYESLFGWKFEIPPGMDDYYLFETTDQDGNVSVGGGLGLRGDPSQKITTYIGVDDIDEYGKNVERLGGKVVSPKMPVPGWGYLSICTDTEGNPFGLWQDDKSVRF
jgi:predicted enzyme related to lactoylglutathione lyase